MQLVLLLVEVKEHTAANAFGAPRRPLIEQLGYAEYARHACDQHVEVAGEAVLQGSHLHQLGHQLFRVGAALEVDGDLQTGKVGLVAHIGNLAHLAVLDQLGDLVDDGLDGGRVRNLRDLDQVVPLVVRPFCTHLERAASGAVDGTHFRFIVDEVAAGGNIRRGQRGKDVVLGIFDKSTVVSRQTSARLKPQKLDAMPTAMPVFADTRMFG